MKVPKTEAEFAPIAALRAKIQHEVAMFVLERHATGFNAAMEATMVLSSQLGDMIGVHEVKTGEPAPEVLNSLVLPIVTEAINDAIERCESPEFQAQVASTKAAFTSSGKSAVEFFGKEFPL